MSKDSNFDDDRSYELLNRFVGILSWLASSDIEERLLRDHNGTGPCNLRCALDIMPIYFKDFLLHRSEWVEEVVGISGMQLLVQFAEAVDDAVYFDEGPKAIGWSKQPRWIEFATLSNTLKNHIEKRIEQHKKGAALPFKYPIEYVTEFIKNDVGYIAQHNKLQSYFDDDFFMRCEYILASPDEYEGVTWSLYNLLKVLYSLTQSAYVSDSAKLYKHGGAWARDEMMKYAVLKDLRENAFTSDNRIAECAQLIIDDFEESISKL